MSYYVPHGMVDLSQNPVLQVGGTACRVWPVLRPWLAGGNRWPPMTTLQDLGHRSLCCSLKCPSSGSKEHSGTQRNEPLPPPPLPMLTLHTQYFLPIFYSDYIGTLDAIQKPHIPSLFWYTIYYSTTTVSWTWTVYPSIHDEHCSSCLTDFVNTRCFRFSLMIHTHNNLT